MRSNATCFQVNSPDFRCYYSCRGFVKIHISFGIDIKTAAFEVKIDVSLQDFKISPPLKVPNLKQDEWQKNTKNKPEILRTAEGLKVILVN
jgi:hypothetical protein